MTFKYSDGLMKRINYPFLSNLEEKISEILKSKDKVIISVVGPRGTGKSYFGKYLRSNGCGRFNRKMVAVIDDSVMWTDFLFFFRRKLRVPDKGIDEFNKLLHELPKKKKIIFYINNTPWTRLSEADILLKLYTDEYIRTERLRQRYGHQTEKIEKGLNSRHFADYKIKYSFLMEEKI